MGSIKRAPDTGVQTRAGRTPRAGDTAPGGRERILRVAARLYARQGYEGTSMRQIAAAAGVTKSLVSYHFGSKRELFSSLLHEAVGTCRATACDVMRQECSAASRLQALVRAQFARAREAPEVVAFAHEVMTMPGLLPLGYAYKSEGKGLFDTYVQLVDEGRRCGEFRDVDARAVAIVAIASVMMYVTAVLAGDLDAIPPGAEDDVFAILLAGIDRRPLPRLVRRQASARSERHTPKSLHRQAAASAPRNGAGVRASVRENRPARRPIHDTRKATQRGRSRSAGQAAARSRGMA
jgi:AcrR family transcriptional regulator